jgi:uncharacterized YceG family protein
MAERTPEERQRAAEERAARRAARESQPPPARAEEPAYEGSRNGDHAESPPPSEPASEPSSESPPPLPRGRQAVAERPPLSRAARAQRVGRPGRPTLPAQAPKPKRWFRRLLALLALLAIGGALYVVNETFQPLKTADEQGTGIPVEIKPGASVRQIGELLERRGVIEDARFFELNATLSLRRNTLRTGRYLLRANMTNGAAIEALQQGPKVRVVKTFKATIPEGLSRREAAPVVRSSGVEGSYMKASGSPSAIQRARRLGLPSSRRTTEGFLFPATYDLKVGASTRTLVSKQLTAFGDNFAKVGMKRARQRGLSRYDVLIIASMIERETPSNRERPLVASVIYNRLREGRPLAIDATIRYRENNWSRPLRKSELERDTPYNTRLRKGLPPTPIGSPGLASLRAAAHPARTRYLFYVAKPGACHAFARTEAGFARAVAAYERAKAANGGKAPKQRC